MSTYIRTSHYASTSCSDHQDYSDLDGNGTENVTNSGWTLRVLGIRDLMGLWVQMLMDLWFWGFRGFKGFMGSGVEGLRRAGVRV